jgi:hypothetical protein
MIKNEKENFFIMTIYDWTEEFYEEGRKAHIEGKTSFECPYSERIPQLHNAWISGWMSMDIEKELLEDSIADYYEIESAKLGCLKDLEYTLIFL